MTVKGSAITITLWLLLTSYEQTGVARVIATEIRDEGTFRWLILPTEEIFHLSLFLFPSFPSKKTYPFSNYYHREFLLKLAHKVAEQLLHRGTGWNFCCNFARSHFSTCRALLQLVCQRFSVSILGHFQEQVSSSSCSKVGYLDVSNQPSNNLDQFLSDTKTRNQISVFLNKLVPEMLAQSVVV